ncbi:hypothetical protein [Micromonospora rubida]|uniref:hypothetical protein n=1 Tax=Micromonospora rubida TaxID=2697657 RepID=UPI001378CA25|nr:hypothetical protein [Micromonospora rubida]NBE80219.1 hypothetical protein [Micromonospora rubida]
MALTACGGEEETPTTAGSTPSASTVPSSAAASASSVPSSSAATDAKGGTSDKKLCESAKKAGNDMKAQFVAAMQSGDPSPAAFKKILTDLDEKLTTLASTGGDSKVAAALKQFGVEASKAAAAADPADAADNPAFEKAGADITAACKAAGVNVNF